ncbi:MAG: L-lactate permease [Gemmatales bacterium]|nr:L-lactate permease [Gemmatales bacterium]MDW8386885.1 L-lactate permease [Gemmatales bacterium]
MLLAYHQNLDPLGNAILSTLFAASPVVVLFVLLVPMRWLAPKAGLGGAITALAVAILVYGMPPVSAFMSFVHGVLFGLLPVGWTIFNAMLLYNITVETGQFAVVRRSVAGLSGDARIQAILIGFAFGAFLEGAAGGGTPVAICGAIMVGLGFDPFLAAVLCLIANTSPVAYGGLGTPLIVLTGVTDLPTETLSVMAGHQLPIMSCIVPLWMTRVMCNWKQTFEVWPAWVVSGGSFALFQYTFATIHTWIPGVVLYPMTDIGGGIFSLVVTAIFLRFWRPKHEWHYNNQPAHVAADGSKEQPLTAGRIALAWAPYAIMSVLLLLTGLVRQQEGRGPVYFGPIRTNYMIPIPWLDREVHRDARLHTIRTEQALAVALASTNPLDAAVNVQLAQRFAPKPERAEWNFAWLTAPGTAVFGAALISMLMLRMNAGQIWRVFKRTCWQMQIPIPTIALMLGLSYVTRYAGMDATLGVAFAATGMLYPFFAAILGWLGVFLTGTDAGSNALFGSLQKITATEVYRSGAFSHLSLDQAQVLICTANSTGGVMGKMIDAQSICVATAATHQIGREADIFKAVVWHSIILAAMIGLLTLLQAYVWPFTLLVPGVS